MSDKDFKENKDTKCPRLLFLLLCLINRDKDFKENKVLEYVIVLVL